MDNISNNKVLQLYKARFNDVAEDFCVNKGVLSNTILQTVVGEYEGYKFCAFLRKEIDHSTRKKNKEVINYYKNVAYCSVKTDLDNIPNFNVESMNKSLSKIGCIISLIMGFPMCGCISELPIFAILMIILTLSVYTILNIIFNKLRIQFKNKWFGDKYLFTCYDKEDDLIDYFSSIDFCKKFDTVFDKYGSINVNNNRIIASGNSEFNENEIKKLLNKIIAYINVFKNKTSL